jgi:hypothetical protein
MYRSDRPVAAVKRVSNAFRTLSTRDLMRAFTQRQHVPSEIRTRLLLLVGLAAVGIILAGVGTAFGADDPVQPGQRAELVVTDENLTVAGANQSGTVVTDISNVTEIRIDRENASRFTVVTRKRRPLTPAERERARTIALENRTVDEAVDGMAAVELAVEPIRKLNASSSATTQYNVSVGARDGDTVTGDTFTIELNDTDGESGSVTIDRTPEFVDNRAVVEIRDPTLEPPEKLKYTVRVDTANGTVTDVTDWEHVRGNATTVVFSAPNNTNSTDG